MSLRHRSTGDGSEIPYEKIESVVSKEDGEEEKGLVERRGFFEKYKFLVSFGRWRIACSQESRDRLQRLSVRINRIAPLSGSLVYGTILFEIFI